MAIPRRCARGCSHEPADVQGAVLEPDPGHRPGQAGLVVEAEEGFPAVAQFLKRLVQGRDAVESDQFGLDRIRSALEIPQPPKGVRVGQIESPGLGGVRTGHAATVTGVPGQPDVSGAPEGTPPGRPGNMKCRTAAPRTGSAPGHARSRRAEGAWRNLI